MKKLRAKFIEDVIDRYKKENVHEYSVFLALMDQRRAKLHNKKTGAVRGQTEMRVALSSPEKLMNQLTYVLNGRTEPKFLEPKGEMKWFVKKYQEFLIPSQY